MTCITFESELIGPQFVSPSTRSPTSIMGTDSTIAAVVIHRSRPRLSFCVTISAIAVTKTPMPTHFIGKPSAPALAVERFRNVFTRIFQRNTSAASPLATSMAVAGHITQNNTSFLVKFALITP